MPQAGRHEHDAGRDAPSGRVEGPSATIRAHPSSVRARAFARVRPPDPFPATPREVLAQAAASALGRQKTVPTHDDGGPPGRQHRMYGNDIFRNRRGRYQDRPPPPWRGAAGHRDRAADGRAGRDHRHRRAAAHSGGTRILRQRPGVGHQRVRPGVRRAAAARWPGRRPARPALDVHCRPAAVLGRFPGRRARHLAGLAAGGPCRRHRRRAVLAVPGDRARHVRGRTARPRPADRGRIRPAGRPADAGRPGPRPRGGLRGGRQPAQRGPSGGRLHRSRGAGHRGLDGSRRQRPGPGRRGGPGRRADAGTG